MEKRGQGLLREQHSVTCLKMLPLPNLPRLGKETRHLPFPTGCGTTLQGRLSNVDSHTPLFTNTGQLILHILLITVLLSSMSVVAIPAAFAISFTIETLTLATVLLFKLRSRSRQTVPSVLMER